MGELESGEDHEMTSPDDPAFDYHLWTPGVRKQGLEKGCEVLGLTKREYFAAMAMQGLCADDHPKAIKMAVHIADALINALNEKPK